MKVDVYLGPRIEGAAERAAAVEADRRRRRATAPRRPTTAFLPLVPAAEHTERITLLTNIAVAFARSPMDLAVTANDLQAMSKGRFVLGVGTQIRPHIENRYSMRWSGSPVGADPRPHPRDPGHPDRVARTAPPCSTAASTTATR